jgi:2-oxoglutarate/2-oxoacid ferredoxin oxidoreductase subunit beta
MAKTNLIGLDKNDYKGAPSTLCAGCGHNSISNQIIATAFELNKKPEELIKFSGIGCSSKSPTYFLNRSFGFNSLHGRMPSVATGALFGDHLLKGIAVSGDGDTTNIGMGQFKHIMRRNIPLVYIIENNGVYGLTKGQFSATAEKGLQLKGHGTNSSFPIDIVLEALISNATFIARSFAGDAKQVKSLLKAAMSHNGTAIIDIISPCVTFNNQDFSHHSFAWAKENREFIHDFSFVPKQDEIILTEDYDSDEVKEVEMHDGSHIFLKKLDRDYDPTNKRLALETVTKANEDEILLTGLIYLDQEKESLFNVKNLPKNKPLNRFTADELRPNREALEKINANMF